MGRRPAKLSGVRFTNPDRVLYPSEGITKLELASFYVQIADWILPHLIGRPLSLVRCPEGQQGSCFFQKHSGPGVPDTIARLRIREKDETKTYLVVEDLAGLVSLVQLGVLEIHVWGARGDRIEQPDRLVFDLDPDPSVAWPGVIAAALETRAVLREFGLESFVKTTGGKGLHIVAPIQRKHGWKEAKQFSKAVADLMVAAAPQRYTANFSKIARRGKIYIDYLRNAREATSVGAYSTRARPSAPVSVPIDWDELTAELRSDHFTMRNLPRRLSSLRRDPWQELTRVRQSLTAKMLKKLH